MGVKKKSCQRRYGIVFSRVTVFNRILYLKIHFVDERHEQR
jgi:hypothetical protein